MPLSDKRRLTDLLLDGQLDALLSDLRAQRMSWDRIARTIQDRTGVYVTAPTVQGWAQEKAA